MTIGEAHPEAGTGVTQDTENLEVGLVNLEWIL